MKLTVVIPVYNVQKYIEKCIASVTDNDLPEPDYEIVVVDDQSPDNSVNIIRDIAKKHPNIKLISQQNKGLGGARNTGIDNASGDFLLFLDADDWMLPKTLSRLVLTAEENSPDILEFAAEGIDEKGKITYRIQNDTHGKIYEGVDYYNNVRYMNSACNKLYNRNFLNDSGLRFKERIFVEDFEFNTRAFPKAKKVMGIPLVAAQFLQSAGSITRNSDASKKAKMYNDLISIIEITESEYRKSEKSKATEKFFMERLTFLVVSLFIRFVSDAIPYREIIRYKNQLQQKGIFYADFPIHDKKKDLFRKVFVKNTSLFRLLQSIVRIYRK